MLNAAILGATGYAGEELIKVLLNHPEVKITSVSAKIEKPERISEIFPEFKGRLDLICKEPDVDEISKVCDVVFLALPHRVSMDYAPLFLEKKKKVIDLSADYRLKDVSVYEEWYKIKHKNPKLVEEAVYGLPELYREKIKKARLIANPGCYPTGAILAVAPALKENFIEGDIIVDAKSGATGAGRQASAVFFFSEVNENLKAYKINEHQHMPEIEEVLSTVANKKVSITFVPHLVPMNRGILSTVYLKLKEKKKALELLAAYRKFYKDESFVRIYDEGRYPEIRDVVQTNFCDIGIKVDEGKKLAIIVACIDNLLKGASGQAVQNMNIVLGFDERLGLL